VSANGTCYFYDDLVGIGVIHDLGLFFCPSIDALFMECVIAFYFYYFFLWIFFALVADGAEIVFGEGVLIFFEVEVNNTALRTEVAVADVFSEARLQLSLFFFAPTACIEEF